MPHRYAPRVDLKDRIRNIPDFPRPGIVFRDITPLLLDPAATGEAVERMARFAGDLGVEVVVAAEARGFILGGMLAQRLGVGFVPARKPGRLPAETVSAGYELEYGLDELHLHADAFEAGTGVLVHDDLIATGGTAEAVVRIVESLGGRVVGLGFVIELAGLGGRDRFGTRPVDSLVTYG